ncbi:hypothetical protein CBM2587_A20029 [Cupriavidus taiwanensis]|uniref:Uncharacterized protein n=1 Tax=Cupriavidus taiwanensis TaxID=164546 RepID=A0A375BPH6_9BURK|nr:hypothetical protein CBM2587_A20029 [Cupriavidus taiwanensis]
MGAYPARAGRAWRQYLRHRARAEHAPAHPAAQAGQAAGITLKEPTMQKAAQVRGLLHGMAPPYRRNWT